MLLANVSLGDLLLTMLWLFFLFMWIWIFITIVGDLFRDHDLSGIGKVVWVVVLIFLPFLGSLVYLVSRGQGMAERRAADQAKVQAAFNEYVREAAGGGGAAAGASPADQLAKLVELKEAGHLSEAEFATMKAKIIN
jgi:ABC-type multidrug transport system fused ATPase/permease subunit